MRFRFSRFCLLLAVVSSFCGGLAVSAGDGVPFFFDGGDIAFTNRQANSVWWPTAVLFSFSVCPTGSVCVARETASGLSFILSPAVTGVTNAAWYADGRVFFKCGDVLRIRTGGGSGSAEVMLGAGD